MKVLYIGNHRVGWSTENEVREALESVGVEVTRAQEGLQENGGFDWDPDAARGHDFVLWTHTHNLSPEKYHARQQRFLDGQRKAKRPVVGYHLDRWWGLNREHQVYDEPYFQQSLICTADGGNDARWEHAGVNHAWFPPAVNHRYAELEVQPKRRLQEHAVAFVGTWVSYHAEWPWRHDMVLWLRRTYGHRLALYPKYGRPMRGRDLNLLYTSVPVILGDSCLSGDIGHYCSDRIPETVGRGGLLLHPPVEGVTDGTLYTDGEHLVTYEPYDYDGIAELIDYFGSDAEGRAKITAAGREHVREHHTYRVRMQRLLELVHGGLADWQ